MDHGGRLGIVERGRELGTGLRAYLERAQEMPRERKRREVLWSDEARGLAEVAAAGMAEARPVEPLRPQEELVAA